MKILGHHALLEFCFCKGELDNIQLIEKTLLESAQKSGATIIKSFFHKFSPQGVSGIILISESHFSIHTWPEYKYASIDMFSCSNNFNLDLAINIIERTLQPGLIKKTIIKRGTYDVQ